MIGLVRLALRRPYTMAIAALLIMLMGVLSVTRMVVDIFPTIDIPVVFVVWNYNGLTAEDMERRVVLITRARLFDHGQRHRAHRVAVDPGHRHPQGLFPAGHRHRRRHRADLRARTTRSCASRRPACSRRTSSSSTPRTCRSCRSRSSSKTLPEQQIFDYGLNFIRGCGCSPSRACRSPAPFGGKQRQIIVDVDPARWQRQGPVARWTWSTRCRPSNVIVPAGIARIGDREYNVQLNSSPQLVEQFNALPVGVRDGVPVLLGDVAKVSDSFAHADQHRAHQRPARELPADPEERRRLDARGGRRGARRAAGDPGRRAGGPGTEDRLRPVGVRARRGRERRHARRSSRRSWSR